MLHIYNKQITRVKYWVGYCILLELLIACSVIDAPKEGVFPTAKTWVILPFQNHSSTPRAGEQVEVMLTTLLRKQGITNIKMYQLPHENINQWFDFDDRTRQDKAFLTAKDKFSYAVSGNIEEWQYKLGAGSEPAVGLTIQVLELPSGNVVWSASGSRAGWSTESLSGTAQKLVRDLISNIKITNNGANTLR